MCVVVFKSFKNKSISKKLWLHVCNHATNQRQANRVLFGFFLNKSLVVQTQPQLLLLVPTPCTQDVCGRGCTAAWAGPGSPLNLLEFHLSIYNLASLNPSTKKPNPKKQNMNCFVAQVKCETSSYKMFGICVGEETHAGDARLQEAAVKRATEQTR